MKKRKLLTPGCYGMIDAKVQLGVPLAKIMRDMSLEDAISRPSLSKLVKHYNTMLEDNDTVISASLFPSWLASDGISVQEQPDNWYYEGYFPLGDWMHEND